MSLFNIHRASKANSAAKLELLAPQAMELSDGQLTQVNGGHAAIGETLPPALFPLAPYLGNPGVAK